MVKGSSFLGSVLLLAIALPTLLLAACTLEGAADPAPPPAAPERATAGVVAASPIAPLPPELAETEVVIVRPALSFVPVGPLWITALDGSRKVLLTPDGVDAWFAGMDGSLAYYVSWSSASHRSLWRVNTTAGERESLLQYSGREDRQGEADLSPDGRYVAFSHSEGIDVLDLTSAERWRVVTSSFDPCQEGPADCYGYSSPEWSSDGDLLLVRKGFWEGAITLVVDPFHDPPLEYTYGGLGVPGPSSGAWSAYGAAFCAFGLYAAPSGLYVGGPPDWRPANVLPEYELPPSPGRDQLWVSGCRWIGPTTIAFLTHVEELSEQGVASDHRMDLNAYSTLTGEWSTATTADPVDYSSAFQLVDVPGGERLIALYSVESSGDQAFQLGQPLLINVATGDITPILEAGDWVVGLVSSPGALPPTGGKPPTR